jgi:hypothetical protein
MIDPTRPLAHPHGGLMPVRKIAMSPTWLGLGLSFEDLTLAACAALLCEAAHPAATVLVDELNPGELQGYL